MPSLFLTAKQLAARWGLSDSTIYELKDKGVLPFYKLGGSIRFRLDDVERYEQQARHSAVIPLRRRGGVA